MIMLTAKKVMLLHKIMAEATGGDYGVRDASLLESALAAPFHTFGGADLYPSIEEKGARLGYSLISNHAFSDGNKRIGMYIMLIFLEVNGAKIEPTQSEVARVGLAVASGEMKYEALLAWVQKNRK